MGDARKFAAHVWGRHPLHHSGADDFSDLLTLGDVDLIVASAARRPAIRLVLDGEVLPESSYCTPRRIGGSRVDDVVDAAKVRDRLDAGATIVLQSLQRTWPSIARYTAALEGEISHTVQANAYLTPAGSTGLRPHSDGHDVIVVQLEGLKRWSVAGLGALTLQSGDTLYMPAGTEHEAETIDEASLHLTIGILRRTHRQVIERLLRQCPTLDRPLPVGFAQEGTGLAESLHDTLIEAATFLSGIVPADAADEVVDRHRTRTFHEGSITSLLAVNDVSNETVIVSVDPGTELTAHGHGRVRLILRDRTLTLPEHTKAALDQIREGSPVRVGTLLGLSTDSRLVLVRRLIREGMVHIAP